MPSKVNPSKHSNKFSLSQLASESLLLLLKTNFALIELPGELE